VRQLPTNKPRSPGPPDSEGISKVIIAKPVAALDRVGNRPIAHSLLPAVRRP
jgi:hypothetical protein